MITFYLTFFRKVLIVHEHPYEKIKNIVQFCVFWYITMTMKFHLFRY